MVLRYYQWNLRDTAKSMRSGCPEYVRPGFKRGAHRMVVNASDIPPSYSLPSGLRLEDLWQQTTLLYK